MSTSEKESRWAGALWIVVLVLWVPSSIRVIGALVCHETFGVEVTLATMAVVFLPWAFRRQVYALFSKPEG